ncbi:MAG: ATP-binding protein [Rhodospirillaceae bacterium]|nr:ATP-binding protein [Rhodospirillaceae bacterium]
MINFPQNMLSDSLHARGGGHATAAGVTFQANIGAWFASHLLAERKLAAPLTGGRVLSVRFETEAPVDDVLIETETGWIFVQAKSSLTLSPSSDSVLAKTAEQFVRQWLACTTGKGDHDWNRPIGHGGNRFLLAMGSNAPKTISVDLADGLAALQTAGSAPLPQSKAKAVRIFHEHVKTAWKCVTGQPASSDDIRSITNLVTIWAFDFDGADRAVAEEMLLKALDTPDQAGATFSTVAQYCQSLMAARTGFDMSKLQQALAAAGIPLAAAPSFQADVQRLRRYSERVQKQLSRHESIDIGKKKVRVERSCTDAVVVAARDGSLLLVGEPGAGKSAVINTSAARLKEEGFDVIQLAVDRLPVNSLDGLAVVLGLEHALFEVLLNWPGNRPAYLFIDALDATRGGDNEAVFRTLIADVLSLNGRQWRVIASIRTFDLRLGVRFRQLFSGVPPSENFSDHAYPDVTHIHVPPWTRDELDRLLEGAPRLSAAVDAGGERLHQLARVPFNTGLIAELINRGLAPPTFSEVQSQVQLLELYWNHRVMQHGTGAELCLEAVVSTMVESRSLRARKLDVASADAKVLDDLLHENVLVALNKGQFVAFRHHILFDYAASRVYLRVDDLTETANVLSDCRGVSLMLAPALAFALLQLWNDDEGNRQDFWAAITRFCGDSNCDPVARSVAARTASELPRVSGDAIGLLTGMSEPTQLADIDSTRALGHVVGALVVRLEDKQTVFLDPWCQLADHASERLDDLAWPLRALLYALYEQVISKQHRAQLGRAARRLLAFCLDSSDESPQLTFAAIDFVAVTYASDIEASRRLLQRLFEPVRFQDHADQEIPRLVERLKPICNADPDFVVEIYAQAFGESISDSSDTPLGYSQILPLVSTRRQDYASAWWRLGQFFPRFLAVHPLHAVRALTRAISGYVKRAEPIRGSAQSWTFSTQGRDVRLQEDRSYLWAWDIDDEQSNSAFRLIRRFVEFLETADVDVAREMIQEMIVLNKLGVLWSRTLMVASKRAEQVGDLLWPYATQEPFLKSLDTQKDAIDFITARYPFENTASRETFERAAMGFKLQPTEQSETDHQNFLLKLFSCVGEQNLATSEARGFVPKDSEGAPSPNGNTRPFRIDTRVGPHDKWSWLTSMGVDIHDPDVARVLLKAEEIDETLELDNQTDEVADIAGAITLVNDLVETAASGSSQLPKSVVEHGFGTAARGTAKLSRLPVERLREDDHILPSLIALVMRLAEFSADPDNAEEAENSEVVSGWSSTNVSVNTAEAVMYLCRVEGEIVDKLRPTIEFLLSSPDSRVRLQIAQRLMTLWNSAHPLMWELAERVAQAECNRGMLRFFANQFLSHALRFDPPRVERLVFMLHGREFNRAEEATRLILSELGTHIALLWIYHCREDSLQALNEWIENPPAFEPELIRAISVLRQALVLKYQNDKNSRHAEITQRAQQFYCCAAVEIAEWLEDDLAQAPQPTSTGANKNRRDVYARLLDLLCREIFHASGAFRSGERENPPLETDESKCAFLADMRPALVRIADVGRPATIHHLIELLEFLLPANPNVAFDLLARALLRGGRQHNYHFESMGANRFVKIVGRCLADYRELFNDEQRRQQLVECLSTFMDAGWPAARRLLYRLPELLQ